MSGPEQFELARQRTPPPLPRGGANKAKTSLTRVSYKMVCQVLRQTDFCIWAGGEKRRKRREREKEEGKGKIKRGRDERRAGEPAQRLRTMAALAEGLGSVPSTHVVVSCRL